MRLFVASSSKQSIAPMQPPPTPSAQRQVRGSSAPLQSGPPSVASTSARACVEVRRPSRVWAATSIAAAVGVPPPFGVERSISEIRLDALLKAGARLASLSTPQLKPERTSGKTKAPISTSRSILDKVSCRASLNASQRLGALPLPICQSMDSERSSKNITVG